MKKVVFICKGNMHRSPIAEALYNALKKDDSFAESYGTWVDKEGRTGVKLSSYPSLDIFANELKKYGTNISNHVCIQVTPEVLKGADKIVMIAEDYSIPDWLKKYNYIKWELPDPDNMTPEEVVEDVKGIKLKVEDLIESLN